MKQLTTPGTVLISGQPKFPPRVPDGKQHDIWFRKYDSAPGWEEYFYGDSEFVFAFNWTDAAGLRWYYPYLPPQNSDNYRKWRQTMEAITPGFGGAVKLGENYNYRIRPYASLKFNQADFDAWLAAS